MTAPKLFISYSWANPDHETWVLDFATELCESGIDVIFDKWNLKEGHDAHAFMEQMVTDKDIKKVILICEKTYVEKADGRSGGVGAEAQIMSAEIYSQQDQSKFVAIVKERDEEGKAYLPVYYRSRIYIDLSEPNSYAENFEKLLRWVFDKPLFEKPAIGKKPAFLEDDTSAVSLATSSRFKRAIDAVRNNRPHASAAVSEYFELFAEELEKLRINSKEEPFDEAVIKSIAAFIPHRNQVIEIFLALALHQDSEETRVTVHRFLEKLIPYLERPQHITSYRDWDFDNYKFIIHELFLYAVASFLKYERFESAAYFMGNHYYVARNSEYGRNLMVSFEIFRKYLKSFESRNSRLELRRLSLHADMLEQRSKSSGIEFRHIMQADFVLFIRDHLDRPEKTFHWYPETLLYVNHGAFEIFARCKSNAYFEKAKVILGIESKENIQQLLNMFETGVYKIPRWNFDSFSPSHLLAFDDIATKP